MVYNNKSGRLYEYDSFRESWVPKKLRDSKSKSTGAYNYQYSSFEEIKYDSVFINGNLKVKKETKFSSSMNLSNTSGTKVETTVIYDAKKDKKNYEVNINNTNYICELDPQKKYRTPTFTGITIKGGL